MAAYAGLSLREIYALKCDQLKCKKNSTLMKELPAVPGDFESLEELTLSKNFVGPKGLLPVLEVVRVASNVKILSLQDNQLTNSSVSDVAGVAATHLSLTTLDFSNNPITLSGGRALLELVQNNTNIRNVVITGTEIRDMVARSISQQCLKNEQALKKQKFGDFTASTPTGSKGGSLGTASLNAETVRGLLKSLPHSINPVLFDKDPVPSLGMLCEQHNVGFQDTQFPPEDNSIPGYKVSDYYVSKWRRASELSAKPCLFSATEKLGVDNIVLGHANDSAVLASLAEVFRHSPHENPIQKLFNPPELSPVGLYSVKFYINGKWRYVLIDDYIPCDKDGAPCFLRPAEGNSVWIMLLEKAIAKVHRNYLALDSLFDRTAEAPERAFTSASLMTDLTGGVGMSRDLNHSEFDPDKWWATMEEVVSKGCLSTATCNAANPAEKIGVGLGPGYTYSVKSVRAVNGFQLLYVCGTWVPEEYMWNGDWSSDSVMWTQYEDVANSLSYKPGKATEDRGFWIAYPDFLAHFASLSICRLFKKHTSVIVEGAWEGQSAGGPYFGMDWCYNPRYELRLEANATMFVQLSLPDSRFVHNPVDTIAIHMIKADYFPIRYEADNIIAKTPYIISDSVIFEAFLSKGQYWFVPSTYTAGQACPYIIRLIGSNTFSVVQQPLAPYWRETRLSSGWDMSGEYQHGDDNPQFFLTVPPPKDGSKDSFSVRVSIGMTVEQKSENSIIFFICDGEGLDGRLAGSIPEELVISKSKYLIADSVTYSTTLGTGKYVVVCCLQPEGSASNCDMSFWCSRTDFMVKEIPFWKKKVLKSGWNCSGVYQSADRNPQFELTVPGPTRIVVKVTTYMANDPAVLFFIVDNSKQPGRTLSGIIPEDKILAKSTYVRSDTVTLEYVIANPLASYLIIPCLQPPGTKATLDLAVSAPQGDFTITELAT